MCPKCLLEGTWVEEPDPSSHPSSSPHIEHYSVEELQVEFPNLTIKSLIAHGGMGSVYRVEQPSLKRDACIKVLSRRFSNELEFVERFRREAELFGKLQHPNIVTVYDASETESGVLYLLMEFVDGPNFQDFSKKRKLDQDFLIEMLAKITEALSVAHSQGITHRDLKPANILLHEEFEPKLTDFGLAKLLDDQSLSGLTSANLAVGTPRYMSPEQWDQPDNTDARSDIYSLGVIFYELATGKIPAGKFEMPSALTNRRFTSGFDELLSKALEHNPKNRYSDAAEFHLAVVRHKKRQRRPALTIAASLASILLILTLAYFWNQKEPPIQNDHTQPNPILSSSDEEWKVIDTRAAKHFPSPEPNSSLGRTIDVVGDLIVAGAPEGGQKRDNIVGAGFLMTQRVENDPSTQMLELGNHQANVISDEVPSFGNLFGFNVAASTHSDGQLYLVAGRLGDTIGGTIPNRGTACVLHLDDNRNAWEQMQNLAPPDQSFDQPEHFGTAVDAHQWLMVVTASGYRGQGGLAIYELGSDSKWRESQWIPKPDRVPDQEQNFGFSVATNGQQIVVGARNDSDDSERSRGSASIYEKSDTGNWERSAKLTDDDGMRFEQFGYRVSISEDGNWIGVMSLSFRDQGRNDLHRKCGKLTLFKRGEDNLWIEHQTLRPINSDLPNMTLTQFGYGMAFSGDWLAVGAPASRSNDESDVDQTGIVFIYRLDSTSQKWKPRTQIKPRSPGGRFGAAIAFGDSFLAVGSPYFGLKKAGAVFIFDKLMLE